MPLGPVSRFRCPALGNEKKDLAPKFVQNVPVIIDFPLT